MKIPNNINLVIIEGIAGAGKTTLLKHLREDNKDRRIHVLTENELMFSWNLTFDFDIEKLRIKLMNKILDYIEKKLKTENCIFVLERFHISAKILNFDDKSIDFKNAYDIIIKRVKDLPVKILIPVLEESEIKKRSSHHERGNDWKEYLELKLKRKGFSNIFDLYLNEQNSVLEIAKEQNISYSVIKVSV